MHTPLVLWFFSLMMVSVSSQKAFPQVETSRGLVVGMNVDHTNTTGIRYISFRGIPYGEQPKRFQLPQQKSPWSGPLYAQEYGLPCPQSDVLFSEDCLKLNVFTPQNSTSERPVLMFIHGGAFSFGSGNGYQPDFLVDQGVIVVTPNFRVGAIGYLTLGSPTAPGNLGLHDILLALRWVQQEINAFGGDPSRVTLMGHSTGSITTNFMMISPLLFQGVPEFNQAITLGGFGLSECCYTSLADAVTRAHQLARALNCDVPTNDTATITCLQAADIHHIVGNQSMINFTIQELARFFNRPFLPVIDDLSVSDRPFFNSSLENLTRVAARRNIPILMGFCQDEGVLAVEEHEYWKLAESHLDSFIPLSVASKLSEKERQHAVDKIKNHYFPNSPDLNKIAGLVKLYGDTMFKHWAIKNNHFYKNTTYAFIFKYDGSWGWNLPYFSQFNLRVVEHGDELPYIFNFEGTNQYFDECKDNFNNLKVRDIMVQFITNFIKTGTPSNNSVPWDVLAKSDEYLVIDSDLSTVNSSKVEPEHFNLWAEIEAMGQSSSTNPFLSTNSFMLLMICVIPITHYLT